MIPNAELVARAWLLAAVPGASGVSTNLPDPPWTNNEFLQIMKVGGSPDVDVPQFNPVISVNCWAMVANSRRPPWGHANELAMRVVMATYAQRAKRAPDSTVIVTLPAGYTRARIHSVFPLAEPNRLPSDPSQYAVYTLDLQFAWSPDGETVP